MDIWPCFCISLHASLLELEIPNVKNALIGGNGVLLVELVESIDNVGDRKALIEGLRPYVEKVNYQCHGSVQISLERVTIASKPKPFIKPPKGAWRGCKP